MNKSEFATLATIGATNSIGFWTNYMEPVFQILLMILALIASVLMVWNRYLDNRKLSHQVKEMEKTEIEKTDKPHHSN